MFITIPTIGSKIVLTSPWVFPLQHEHRNSEFYTRLIQQNPKDEVTKVGASIFEDNRSTPRVTLPKGTVLKIDRIYIRGRNRDFDSITFRALKCRFWAKLKDVNNIQGLWEVTTIPRGKKKT